MANHAVVIAQRPDPFAHLPDDPKNRER